MKHETQVLKRAAGPQILKAPEERYQFPKMGEEPLSHRPVVVGMGPAGLFCGLMLARAGFKPLILERGGPVEERRAKVERFWAGGGLDLKSNVQFGEGGAGTFSDGKLNTLVKDATGRNREVHGAFWWRSGADPCHSLSQQKPHIGTDRADPGGRRPSGRRFWRLGGRGAASCTQVTDCGAWRKGDLRALDGRTARSGWKAEAAVLAVGHSARDTFETLLQPRHIPWMEPKAFAVGLRHPAPPVHDQPEPVRTGRSGRAGSGCYKVTWKAASGRGVYSFCMCPGGYVVDASSRSRGVWRSTE